MGPSDEELVRRVQRHDNRHAFAMLVKRYQSEVRNSLRRMTHGDASLADDLAQETFVRVHRSIHTFRGDSSFRTWVYRVAYRCFLSEIRKSAPPLETIEEHHWVEEQCNEQDAFMRDFNRAMTMLSAPQRDAVHFSIQRGFAHPDIAEIMGIPLGTVKTHVMRGRQKLQEMLSDWQEGLSNE